MILPYKSKEDAKAAQKRRYEKHRTTKPFLHKCSRARSRSQSLKVDFDLTPQYLESIWTGICPVLKVPIHISGDRNDEFVAELDRFIPHKGYVQGNVHFLSRRINRLKNNVSSKELEELLTWMKEHESK